MINDKMRSDWGFDGFVVSDCDAISDDATHAYIVNHFNGSLQVQAQQAIRGGTDKIKVAREQIFTPGLLHGWLPRM